MPANSYNDKEGPAHNVSDLVGFKLIFEAGKISTNSLLTIIDHAPRLTGHKNIVSYKSAKPLQ